LPASHYWQEGIGGPALTRPTGAGHRVGRPRPSRGAWPDRARRGWL